MKKIKSVIALVLALIMALSLAACGKDGDDNNSANKPGNTEHPDFVYTAEFKPLDLETDRSLNVLGSTDEGIYISWNEKVGEDIPEGATLEYEGQYDVYEARIGLMDFDGNLRKLENYKPMPRIENTDGKKEFYSASNLSALYPLADGRILTVEIVYGNWNDAPEGVTEGSDDYWNYYQYSRDYYIRVLESDGSEVSTNLIGNDAEVGFNTYASAVTPDGNFITSQDTSLVVIGQDGSTLYKIDGAEDMYFDRMLTLKDGSIAVTTWGENGIELLPVDLEGKKLGEAIPLPREAYDLYPGAGDYDLYYNSGINLFGYDLTAGESTKLLNWMDCDINSSEMSGMTFTDDGRIIAVLNHWSYNRYSRATAGGAVAIGGGSGGRSSTREVVIVSKVPYESVPEKTILTLAAQYMGGSSLSNAIIDFNRGNDKYRISVKDYSEYNTQEDYTAGMTKLSTEIMAGNLPDMLLLSGNMPYEQYAAKGLLEDLYPFIDSDSEISREDFFPTILAALEVDGKLCQAASSFSIQSVLGPKSLVGDTPGWTYEQYNQALAQMPEGCSGFDAYTLQGDMLNTMLAADSDYYVNWSTGECRFDSPEFINLLEFAATFPADMPDDYEWVDTGTLISEGRQMLATAYIYDFDNILYNDFYFGPGNSTYIGYPTNEGVGNMLNINNGIAITKNCVDKDGAWQFVRTFLTEKGQDALYDYSMPTNINLYDKYLEQAMATEYEQDGSGNYVLDENGERIPISRGNYIMSDGTEYEIYAVSQEQADMLRDLINSTTKLANYNDSIFSIVQEQASAFFAGQKPAEEVARLIQSKANIYVNEQR